MKLYVGITDYNWYTMHALRASGGIVEELNFWRPSSTAFKVLQPGELFLFKLHAPRNFLVGGGFFICYAKLPVQLAWDAFGTANGVESKQDLLQRIEKYRGTKVAANHEIACILLGEPFFFRAEDWIPVPDSFRSSTQQGKTYDTETPEGQLLWQQVMERMERATIPAAGPAMSQARATSAFGQPVLVRPRLGQGAFRVLVTEAYDRRCAMTGERTLPALEAAHIRPYAEYRDHDPSNGLLLRSDLHRLFDLGYVTLDPKQRTILVSERIKSEFENGKEYYRLHGSPLADPVDPAAVPSELNLRYHAENIFR